MSTPVTPATPNNLKFSSINTSTSTSGSSSEICKFDWSNFNLQEGLFMGKYSDPLANWTSETGNEHKFACSKFGYAYDPETNELVEVIKGKVNGLKDLAVIILSYTHLYDYFPINCSKGMWVENWFGLLRLEAPDPNMIIFKPKDVYYHETKIFMEENIFWYMKQWILVNRILQPDEPGYKENEEVYTRQWQDRMEFAERIYASYLMTEEEWIKDGLWSLRQSVLFNDNEKSKLRCRTYCYWLQDFTVQADDEIIFLINDAELIQESINWRALPIWKDANDFIPAPQQSLQDIEDSEYFYRLYR